MVLDTEVALMGLWSFRSERIQWVAALNTLNWPTRLTCTSNAISLTYQTDLINKLITGYPAVDFLWMLRSCMYNEPRLHTDQSVLLSGRDRWSTDGQVWKRYQILIISFIATWLWGDPSNDSSRCIRDIRETYEICHSIRNSILNEIL